MSGKKKWYVKKQLDYDTDKITNYAFRHQIDWKKLTRDGQDAHNGAARWGEVQLSRSAVKAIEKSTGVKIKPPYYILDYKEQKDLVRHIDFVEESNHGTRHVCLIQLDGEFELKVYKTMKSELYDSVKMYPRDIIFFDNTKWYHAGKVLSNTRKVLVVKLYEDYGDDF